MQVAQDTKAIERNIREFIVSNFMFGVDDGSLKREDSFLQNGVIDSTGVLELVAYLEQSFKIEVDDHELVPVNLDSIQNVAAYVSRKLGSGPGWPKSRNSDSVVLPALRSHLEPVFAVVASALGVRSRASDLLLGRHVHACEPMVVKQHVHPRLSDSDHCGVRLLGDSRQAARNVPTLLRLGGARAP